MTGWFKCFLVCRNHWPTNHVHDHGSFCARSRRWGEYWLELLGDSGFVPEDRLAMPELYKNYMIVGVAIETPKLKGWRLKGIIYSKSGKELKQLELKQATFSDKITAQSDALRMCRYWVDTYGSEFYRLLKMASKAGVWSKRSR